MPETLDTPETLSFLTFLPFPAFLLSLTFLVFQRIRGYRGTYWNALEDGGWQLIKSVEGDPWLFTREAYEAAVSVLDRSVAA
jgi:hypothetical protein